MTDKESLSKLEKILKQLEKISNNTGVSAGVKNAKGETKSRANLTSEEVTRETKIAKIYKSILGTGYNQADADKTAERFRIKLGVTTTYYVKTEAFLQSIRDNIEQLNTNLNFNALQTSVNNLSTALTGSLNFQLTTGYNNIKDKLDELIKKLNFTSFARVLIDIKKSLVGLGKLNTSNNFTNIENILNQIEQNTKKTSGGGSINFKDVRKGVAEAFKTDLKWVKFSDKIIDYIDKNKGGNAAGKIFETLRNVGGLALLGTGLILVVTALAKTGMVDVVQSLKVMGLITTFIGVMLYLGNKFNKIKGVGKNLAILMATVVGSTLALVGLSKIPVELILIGIFKTSFVYFTLYNILKYISKIGKDIEKDKLKESVISLGLFAGVVIATTLSLVAIGLLPFSLIIDGLINFGIVGSVMYGVLFLFKKIKTKDLQDTMKSLAMFVGITTATLLLTIAFSMIPFMTLLEGLFKMMIVSAVLLGVLKVMEYIKPRNVLKSMLGLTVFAAILYFGVLPLLEKLKNFEVGKSIKSIVGIGLALTAFSFLVRVIGEIVKSGIPQILIGAIAIVGLSFIIGIMANNLSKLADMPWLEIYKGLGLSVLAITLFGVVVAAIGALMLTGIGAALLAAGGAAVIGLSIVLSTLSSSLGTFANKPWDQITEGVEASIKTLGSFSLFLAKFGAMSILLAPFMAIGAVSLLAMSKVMGSFAEELVKYSDIDGGNLKIIGEGMQAIGIGLMAMLGGTAASVGTGVINNLTSFFGLDPVGQIRKFEKVDVEKIYKLGEGVKMLGDGLKTLSSTDINLTRITDGVIKLTKPLAEFSGSLEKFSDAYTKFEKVKMQSDNIFNIEADTGIKQAIKEATDRQLDVQMDQLVELRKNNELMEILINRASNSGGMMASPFGNSGGESGTSLTSPVFKTKNEYLSNVKMMTMSISNA